MDFFAVVAPTLQWLERRPWEEAGERSRICVCLSALVVQLMFPSFRQ